MTDLVSIVVPVYNMSNSIEQCVQSLMNQDYNNLEIILVDDGSKDNSYDVCLNIANRDGRIRVIHTENRGSGPARNTGIENAKGEYIYFPDADDYLEPYAISRLVKATNGGQFDLVVFGYRNAHPDGKTISEKKYQDQIFDADTIRVNYAEYMTNAGAWCIQGAPWNKFFSLNVIRNNSIRYPSLRRHQDEGFIGRYMCYAEKVCFVSDVLYTYYVNDLHAEWKKYPVDYIDAVIGLFQVRKETIFTWNEKDCVTHDMIIREYICNIIKSIELSFSPKMNLNNANRRQWIEESIAKSHIKEYYLPERFNMPYQKMCMSLIRRDKISILYNLLKMKIIAQKNLSFLNRLRKG